MSRFNTCCIEFEFQASVGAYGKQMEMAVISIDLHHALLELNLDAACIETTHSATFCNNPEASQTHAWTLLHGTQLFGSLPPSVQLC